MNQRITKLLFSNFLILLLSYSCSNSKVLNTSNIEFTEELRLNHSLNLDEVTVINKSQELVELYTRLKDPSIPRSAPIPAFDESTECILVLKPELKKVTYGDIEITSIEKSNSKLLINYKELESAESTGNKWSDPIVILKISEKSSEIQLNRIN